MENNIDYKVLMYDGTIKPISKVIIGDKLIGPDSQQRNVINTFIGYDEIINVIFSRNKIGFSFNQNHKLFLKNYNNDEFELLTIKDCVNFRKKWKISHRWMKTFIRNFGVTKNNFIIPPYILGLLLGDGYLNKDRITLTTMDDAITEQYETFVNSLGYSISISNSNNSKAYHIKYIKNLKENLRNSNGTIIDPDVIRSEIRRLNLLGTKSHNKFIPAPYKTSSYTERLDILAGLLDTDGYLNPIRNVFDFVSKSKQLSEDVVFIANSCGLTTSIKEVEKKSIKYYRVYIGGNTKIIPTKLQRKKANNSNDIKNTRILNPTFNLCPIGKHRFYGLTTDLDNLYLAEDFSVICGK